MTAADRRATVDGPGRVPSGAARAGTSRTWTLPDLTGTAMTANNRLHHHARARVTAEWRALAAAHTRAAHIPHLAAAHILATWLPADAGRRDPGNAYPMVKACCDGIVDAGVLDDDDATHLTGPVMELGPVTPRGPFFRGTVTLRITITEVAR
jgi:hypothetical protein